MIILVFTHCMGLFPLSYCLYLSLHYLLLLRRYCSVYQNFSALYSRAAEADVDRFLRADHSLKEYRDKIDHLKSLAGEITSMDNFVPFHLFLIDCTPVKEVSLQASEVTSNTLVLSHTRVLEKE